MTVHRLPTCPGGGADLVQRPETADAMLAIALLCAFVLQLISCWSRPPVRGRAWAVGLLVEFAVLGVSVWAGIANMACISVAGVRLMRVVDGSV
jgi:hypothetical protein